MRDEEGGASVIIDMHMHIEEVASLGWKMSAEDCVQAMDAAGVDSAAVMTLTDLPGLNPQGLELIADACASHPGRLHGFLRLAGELGVPTLFHCGDEPMSTPLSIAEAAAACPDSTIVLGHMGGYFHVDEAIDVAEQHPNLILETSAMPYPDKIRTAVERIGAERVVFGSDGPVSSPSLERQKVVIADLGGPAAALVLGGNAAVLLGLA